jgi:prepilin signal peptidase PulO-like enzyme (type II secretory pathway)
VLVELGTAVIFLLFGLVDTNAFALINTESLTTLLIHLCIASILVVIFVYDLRHMIIPDEFSFALSAVSIILLVKIFYFSSDTVIVISHLTSALFVAGFLWLLWFFSDGRWMGFGDVKLMIGLGMLNALPQGVSGLVFAFWIGAVFSLIHLGYSRLRRSLKKITMKTEIPFAPFLIIGSILAFLIGSDIFHLSYLFS